MTKKRLSLCVILGMLLSPPAVHALEDGIYAVFHTSMGSVTAQLYYAEAPMTVANFVGLAEGTRSWIDVPSGAVRTEPFYDGGIFHRVIDGFMIQGGSRNQLGTDGPGYRFPDEIPNGRWHSQVGVLSMANSGIDSNGSQFFITVAPTAWLDGAHTVFGQVVSGQAVVDAISQVAVGGNDRPLDDVFIFSIEIIRIGPDAETFDASAMLPMIQEGRAADIYRTGNALHLSLEPNPFHEYYVRASSNLVDWSSSRLMAYADSVPAVEPVYIGTNWSRQAFYTITELHYPGNEHAPASLSGRHIDFQFTGPSYISGLRVEYLLNPGLGNVIRVNGINNGLVAGSSYERLLYPNRSSFLILGTEIVRIDYRMEFLSPTNGLFTAIIHTNPRENSGEGVFTVSE